MKKKEWIKFEDKKPELKKGKGELTYNSNWLRVRLENGRECYASYWQNGNWLDDRFNLIKQNVIGWRKIGYLPDRLPVMIAGE